MTRLPRDIVTLIENTERGKIQWVGCKPTYTSRASVHYKAYFPGGGELRFVPAEPAWLGKLNQVFFLWPDGSKTDLNYSHQDLKALSKAIQNSLRYDADQKRHRAIELILGMGLPKDDRFRCLRSIPVTTNNQAYVRVSRLALADLLEEYDRLRSKELECSSPDPTQIDPPTPSGPAEAITPTAGHGGTTSTSR